MSTTPALERSPLTAIAADLRTEGSLISDRVVEESQLGEAGLGALVAAGPRAAADPFEYALVIEAIREGYLLHYGEPRLVSDVEPDLALLAGDYLYALGLERLAKLGDEDAVALLGDLISLTALCHREGLEDCVSPLWLATTVAVGCGEAEEIKLAKESLKGQKTASYSDLWRSAETTAKKSGIGPALLLAAKAIDFPAVN
jgi:hypothetical protein